MKELKTELEMIKEKEKFSRVQKKLGIKGFEDMHLQKGQVGDFEEGKKKKKIKKMKRRRKKFNEEFLQGLNSLSKRKVETKDQSQKPEVDPELDKLLKKTKRVKTKSDLNKKAYDYDLDQFLTVKPENGGFARPRVYQQKSSKSGVTFEDINTNQKGILVSQKRKEEVNGLEALTRGGSDGTKSIIDLKLPSEMLQDRGKQNIVDPEEEQKIKEDLQKLPDSVFLTEFSEKQDGNLSTVYMMRLLKSRAINRGKDVVSKKERYEKFLDEEKNRKTNDAGDKFYNKMVDKMVLGKESDALPFDKQRFLAKKKPIIIEYRNKMGQVLDKKEAFNEMCLKFHGVKRSVTKVERLRKNKEKRQREQAKTNSIALPSFFKGAKKITNKAFINLTKDLN